MFTQSALYLLIFFVIAITTIVIINYKPKAKANSKSSIDADTPFTRAHEQARVYAITHKAGTEVVAENKNGEWKKGTIIGDHDWALFTFFFTIQFSDGEIIKQEERKVTKI